MPTSCPTSPLTLTDTQIAIAALAASGVQNSAIAKHLKISDGYVRQVKQKVSRKYDLTASSMVRSAHSAVKSLVKGEAFGTIEKVKDSTALAAAQMIYDRYQPVRGRETEGGPAASFIDFSTINISVQVQSGAEPQAIECRPVDNSEIK